MSETSRVESGEPSGAVPTAATAEKLRHAAEVCLAELSAALGTWETYHNHKETMAWTATAFHAPSVVIAAGAVASHVNTLGKSCASALILLVGFCAVVFVHMQFQMRWIASDVVDALRRSHTRLLVHLAADDAKLAADFVLPSSWDATGKDLRRWPKFVEDQITHCTQARSWSLRDPRMRTEIPSYMVTLAASSVAIMALWTVG